MATTKMDLTYLVNDKPKFGQLIVFALQQLLAIMAATIAVPAIVGHGMSSSAALFGAGVGTIVYLLFTKFKSPVFLGSSFAFLGSMAAAFAGGVSAEIVKLGGGVNNPTGYLGLLIGAALAGLVYVIISLVVKFCGTGWIDKLMPPVVIGPTVAIIGLSLAGNAINDLIGASAGVTVGNVMQGESFAYFACGLVTLFAVVISSVYVKNKFIKMIPFVIGIVAGYIVATIFTLCGIKIIDFSAFERMQWYPDFTFLTAFEGNYGYNEVASVAGYANFSIGSYIGTIAVAYVPVAFVVFAEHIADHKNLSSIIGEDLLENPGLHRTLLGDGVGSIAGAFFGGCPNTTYGESVGCVAISGNASVITIFVTALMAIVISFIGPISTLLATIPSCVMGGVCLTLYGFIAVSGLKMIQDVDLNKKHNLFVVSAILIAGIGGMSLTFGKITITEVAAALILGIIVNLVCLPYRNKYDNRKEA